MHTFLIEHCNKARTCRPTDGDMPQVILTTMWNPNCYSTLLVSVVCVYVCGVCMCVVCVCVGGDRECKP